VLGLAQFGNLINDGCDQYFHVTDAGIEYLRKVGADAMTAPIDPAAPVNIAPLRRLLAEQKASHYALDWKDLTQLLDEIDRLRKLFTDAGQGEHNVLALIDHYQQETFAAQAEVARLRLWLVAFAECAEAAERNAASDGTGMLVPFHQDFAGIKSNPALRRDLRWWANACREAAKETK